MGSSKRKRQSTDSAIADMSGEDSQTQASESSSSTAQKEEKRWSKRRRGSWGLDARDFGTAASQRPRRGAMKTFTDQHSLPQKTISSGATDDTLSTATKDMLSAATKDALSTATPQVKTAPTSEQVNRSNEKHKQTPQRKQAPFALPTPPQTVEKTDTQSTSLRRSIRERRLTERAQQAPIEETTPCRKKSNRSILSANNSQNTAEDNRKSCIVRLRVTSLSTSLRGSQMSLTGSFSHRHKSVDEQDSQASHQVSQPTSRLTRCADTSQTASFVDNRSFQDHGSVTFAQPRPEAILADSQDLYSSQLGTDIGSTAVDLQEHVPGATEFRQQFTTSSWVARHDRQSFDPTPEKSHHHQGQNCMRQSIQQVDSDNESWQTQATIPWCPPSSQDQTTVEANLLITPHATSLQGPGTVTFHASQATTIDETPVDSPPSLSKERLHAIAEDLFAHRTYGPPKPEPVGQPAVWADARMDLCETLPYFRSYQGACYSTGGFVRGFMFDKVAHVRDYIDSNVVIARAGGGQVRDKESGELKASGDQVEGATSQSLRNCMSHYNPVVIITGVDNPHMPSQPPQQYSVLDYFKPTHIWAEKSGKGKIVRYRFEKLNARRDSWWRAKDVEDSVELGSLPPPFVKACGTCAKESVQIYLNGWMCLSPTCPSFWLILPSSADALHGVSPFEPNEASLTYDPRFLKSHTPWPNDTHEYSLTPPAVSLSSHAVPGEDTSEAFTRGLVCPDCRRCTSRLAWRGWECACGWTFTPPHTLIPAQCIREPLWPLTPAYTPSRDIHSPLVSVSVSFAHGYRVNTYTLPGIDGFVTHMIANQTVVAAPGGADDMFEELQGMDIGLRRRPLEGGMLKGGMYTRHFVVNYGMPYKFIAATESFPFPGASHPVSRARRKLNWAAGLCVDAHSPSAPSSSPGPSPSAEDTPNTSHFTPFNEVLALGYLESQRISYHDDGETGLGPTIATLSLGSPGTMRLRLKAKHHSGVSAAGLYTATPPVPGCAAYAQRLALVDELAALKETATGKEWRSRLKEIPRELGLKNGNARDVLTMRVAHGDVVVMHGEGVQGYYEHSVEHAGKLRFALTSRWIDPASVAGGVDHVEGNEGGEVGLDSRGELDTKGLT